MVSDAGNALAQRVRDRFPSALQDVVEWRGELTLVVDPASVLEVAHFLKDDPALDFDYFLYNTAVDWPARDERFDVVWEVRSLRNKTRVRLKCRVGMPDPHVASLVPVWRAANWYERETWDLLGIRFDGHPDLRRILMPDSWEGHPLRKDYVSFGEPVIFSDQKLEGLEPDAIRG
jgi:NADH-quinone oxidoreductase subunit C